MQDNLETDHKCKNLNNSEVCGQHSKLNPVSITYSSEFSMWEVTKRYTYPVGGGFTMAVPEKFHFDLASIPRPLWPIIAPFELSVVAPLIHDVLYYFGGCLPKQYVATAIKPKIFTRLEADLIFYRIMLEEGVPQFKARIAYRAVRVFGKKHWDARAKKLCKENPEMLVSVRKEDDGNI